MSGVLTLVILKTLERPDVPVYEVEGNYIGHTTLIVLGYGKYEVRLNRFQQLAFLVNSSYTIICYLMTSTRYKKTLRQVLYGLKSVMIAMVNTSYVRCKLMSFSSNSLP